MKQKINKRAIVIILIILFFVGFIAIRLQDKKNVSNKPNEIKVGVYVLPDYNNLYLDTSEVSTFINPLVYPAAIKLTDTGYEKIIAKDVNIKQNEITVKYSLDISDEVILSLKKYGRESYENNLDFENIEGFSEYLSGASNEISGVEKINENTLKFKVKNEKDLKFLVMPICCGNIGKYQISDESNSTEIILINTDSKIIISQYDLNNYDSYDLIISAGELLLSEDFSLKTIDKNYNFIILANYPDNINKKIENIINGKKESLEKINIWLDASYESALVKDKIKKQFDNSNVELNIDYAEYFYLMDLIETGEQCIIYYEGNSYNSEITNLSNVKLIPTGGKQTYFYYKNTISNIINNF